jgi:light-regulated signal transduction histidine kinase (bacteriophytochrome)
MDGFSQALMEDYYDVLDDQGHDYLNRIRAASQRMAQLIDDLQKLSRLTRGELNLAPVDLSALVRGIAADLQRMQPERKVEFRIAQGVKVTGDQNLLKAVLENLLGNAWKFTGKTERATIEFGASNTAGAAVYFVRDNGAGFDNRYADKLFGVFQRLHAEKDFSGSGIGLSIVQRIVHRHGGKVWAEGERGKGATFYFTLGAAQ